MSHITGLTRTSFRAWPERDVPVGGQAERFFALVGERASGQPVAYLLGGEQEFWSLSLRVSPSTLIPPGQIRSAW